MGLTRIANRRRFDERLDEEVERARRAGCPLSVVVADLDGFKALNDALGHTAGDRRLCDLADRWRGAVRDSGDLLARLGGDEFALLAPSTDEVGSHRLVDRLAAALPEGVRASLGAATWDRAEHASDLVRRDERGMYHAKRRRRRGAAAASGPVGPRGIRRRCP